MFQRLTDPARAVVSDAVLSAQLLRATAVEPRHLLLGLAQAPGTAQDVLTDAGIDAATLRTVLGSATGWLAGLSDEDAAALATVGIDLSAVVEQLAAAFPQHDAPAPRRRRLRLSATSRRCLHLAVREASWLKARSIGTEHLLLGLLRADDASVRHLLEEKHCSAEQLRLATLAQLDQAA